MKTACLLILFLSIWAGRALSQPLTFDENGHGTNYAGLIIGGRPVPFTVAPDPSHGITTAPVLIYFMGYQVLSGDIALVESNGAVSDLIRFFNPIGSLSTDVIFYSDLDDANHD